MFSYFQVLVRLIPSASVLHNANYEGFRKLVQDRLPTHIVVNFSFAPQESKSNLFEISDWNVLLFLNSGRGQFVPMENFVKKCVQGRVGFVCFCFIIYFIFYILYYFILF